MRGLVYIVLQARSGLPGGLGYPLSLYYQDTPTPHGGNRQTHPTYIPPHIFWVFLGYLNTLIVSS